MSDKFFHDWRYLLSFVGLMVLCFGFSYSWDHTVKVKHILAERRQVLAQTTPTAPPVKPKKKKKHVELQYWRGKFPYCTNGKVRLSDQLIVTCADGTVWFDGREHFQ